ncbi:MAG: hypothetical protein FWF49_03470, partial [Oscillospiraceae bacterium]|nr:hypothetical protein [Oscillospiraceae bacterium]
MYKLESNSISATFDRKGSVVSIFDKRLEREFLTAKGFEKLFRIMLPSDKWDGRHADSNEQEDAKVENKTDTGITFFYPQLKKEDEIFNVAIRANIKLEDENLIFSLDVENNDNVLVSHIIYPIIGGIGKDNNDLRYYAPVQEKRVINPFTELGNWNHKCWVGDNNKWIWRYPN